MKMVTMICGVLGMSIVAILADALADPRSAKGLDQAANTASPTRTTSAQTSDDAIAAFATVQIVLQHPRCQNCHSPGDAPLQFDAGIAHTQGIARGVDGKGAAGLPCATCHGAANPPASYGLHTPSGAPNWHLPPPEHKMVFIGLPAAELCANLRDPKKNGGKDMTALIKHVDQDGLVLWGWNPGGDRAPVPITHADFVAQFTTWAKAGGPCPPA
ncbi:MAG: hypothetical protein ABI451_04320 [Dokdonella sp.]